MKNIKYLLSIKTLSENYKKDKTIFIIYIIIMSLIILFSNIMTIPSIVDILFRIIGLLVMIVLIPILILRVVGIGSNIEKLKLRDSTKKFKYKSVEYSFDDIVFWLRNANEPDDIYVTANNSKIYNIAVTFEVKGKNGSFFNKQFSLNYEVIDLESILTVIQKECLNQNGFINVNEMTEKNDPNLFIKTINYLKNR